MELEQLAASSSPSLADNVIARQRMHSVACDAGHTTRMHSETQTKQTQTQTHTQTHKQTHRHADAQTHRHTQTHRHRHRHRHTDTDTQTQTHRHRHRHTHRHTQIHRHAQLHRHRHRHTPTPTPTPTPTHTQARARAWSHAYTVTNTHKDTHPPAHYIHEHSSIRCFAWGCPAATPTSSFSLPLIYWHLLLCFSISAHLLSPRCQRVSHTKQCPPPYSRFSCAILSTPY